MCSECGLQFVTVEHYELIKVPHCGIRAPFSRARVVTAVRTAAQGQRQVMNAAAHRRRTRGQPLGTSLPYHLPQRRTTEPSDQGASSPYSLVSASGRG